MPDARDIVDELTQRGVKLNIGGPAPDPPDPTDPIGGLLFNVLAMIAEFELDLAQLRTREGMKVARAKGRAGCAASNPSSNPAKKPTSSPCGGPANTPAPSWPTRSVWPARRCTGPSNVPNHRRAAPAA